MPLTAGTRLGPYEVVEPIGKGGMGEVYRARDTKLDRDVAIKVLPDELAADEERVARFEREAKLLASLNHPNIASIYGFESNALVLELVEGPTLAEQIRQGPIPVDEAIVIAKQIAEALEAGHEAGVIHRDLKPANVKVKEDGTVKVLDYGLAKALEGDAAGADPELSQSPTLTRHGTQIGMILGTAAYMSPEQAKGKQVDKRTDIFAFGALCYEMLTARKAFAGEDVSEVLAAVLKTEPDWNELPTDLDARLENLFRRCLRKDRKTRLRDIGDARNELDEILTVPATRREPVVVASRNRERLAWWLAGSFVLSTLVLALVHFSENPPKAQAIRFTVPTPPEVDSFSSVQFAVSPDGNSLAFIALTGAERLLGIRPLDSIETRMVSGTDNAGFPFWSPDSEFIGYFADGKLKKVRASGGPSETLCDAYGQTSGSWSGDDVIVFGSSQGILRVDARGGSPSPVTALNETRREIEHAHPQFLPDSNRFLFLARSLEAGNDGIYVGALDFPETKRVLSTNLRALYVRTGYLLSMMGGEVLMWPFDADALETSESGFPLLEEVRFNASNAGVGVSVSQNGVFAYHAGAPRGSEGLLVTRARDGRDETVIHDEPLDYLRNLRLSPDGRRLAVAMGDDLGGQIWIFPLDGRPPFPLTKSSDNSRPVWSPDGTRIAFASTRDGARQLYWMAADGSAVEPERISSDARGMEPGDWSADGNELIVEGRRNGIFAVTLDREEPLRMVMEDENGESRPRLSPDGAWLAYASSVTGRREIWVRPYPGPGAPVRVTANGGADPVWSRDGRELFFLEGALGTLNARLMGVETETTSELSLGSPRVIVDGGFVSFIRDEGAYDVAPDGRFVTIRSTSAETDADVVSDQLTVVVNWHEELELRARADN